MATREQYEKIFGKVSDAQWAQVSALHAPAAHSIAPLAALSTTPGAAGVTAYRMGSMDHALHADQLARYRKFYTVPSGSDGSQEGLAYLGGGAPGAAAPGASPPVAVMRGGPAATPEQQALAAAHAPGDMTRPAPVPLTAVQDPGNMEVYQEPETPVYPMVKPAAVAQPIMKPGGYVKAPIVTLAPQEDLDNPKSKKKGKNKDEPSAFKMPMLGDAPDESPIPPPKGKG